MKVVVAFTTESRADLVALLSARTKAPGDAVRFAAEFLVDMEEQLRENDGVPPGAKRYVDDNGAEWWWKYTNGVWLVYSLEDRTSWMFKTVRQVTVVAFESQPPTP